MRNLAGRRVLLTGASGGLGRSIAQVLAAAGADLAMSGRDLSALASVAAAVRALGRTAAKGGLARATQSLRLEYAGTGVGISVVIPGFVTGAGIFARHQAAGVTAPGVFGTVTAEAVRRGVLRAIRRNAPQLFVTGRPIRPLLALTIMAPRLAQRITGWAGVTAVARQVAALHGRLDDPRRPDDGLQAPGAETLSPPARRA